MSNGFSYVTDFRVLQRTAQQGVRDVNTVLDKFVYREKLDKRHAIKLWKCVKAMCRPIMIETAVW